MTETGFPAAVFVVQKFTSVLRDEDEVFNADAEAARKVNARFNGKDHAGLGSKRSIRADFACFMLPDADEMAKAVREV